MAGYILRFRGAGPIPKEDIERISSLEGVNVLDSTSRMLLVDAPDDELKSLVDSMPQWVLSQERTISRPDPRPRIEREFKNQK